MSTATLTQPYWTELRVHLFDGGGGSLAYHDGYRVFTLASIEGPSTLSFRPSQEGLIRVNDIEVYPQTVQHLFPAPQRRVARLIDADAFIELWGRMRDLSNSYGYPPEIWAPAVLLMQESAVMCALHPHAYTAYTFEECLAISHKFRPTYTINQLGILIDNGVTATALLSFDATTPYGYLEALYPRQVTRT